MKSEKEIMDRIKSIKLKIEIERLNNKDNAFYTTNLQGVKSGLEWVLEND